MSAGQINLERTIENFDHDLGFLIRFHTRKLLASRLEAMGCERDFACNMVLLEMVRERFPAEFAQWFVVGIQRYNAGVESCKTHQLVSELVSLDAIKTKQRAARRRLEGGQA